MELAPKEASDTAWKHGEECPGGMPQGVTAVLWRPERAPMTQRRSQRCSRGPRRPREDPFQGTFVGHKLVIQKHAELRGLSQNCKTLFKAWSEPFRFGRVLQSRKRALSSMEWTLSALEWHSRAAMDPSRLEKCPSGLEWLIGYDLVPLTPERDHIRTERTFSCQKGPIQA